MGARFPTCLFQPLMDLVELLEGHVLGMGIGSDGHGSSPLVGGTHIFVSSLAWVLDHMRQDPVRPQPRRHHEQVGRGLRGRRPWIRAEARNAASRRWPGQRDPLLHLGTAPGLEVIINEVATEWAKGARRSPWTLAPQASSAVGQPALEHQSWCSTVPRALVQLPRGASRRYRQRLRSGDLPATRPGPVVDKLSCRRCPRSGRRAPGAGPPRVAPGLGRWPLMGRAFAVPLRRRTPTPPNGRARRRPPRRRRGRRPGWLRDGNVTGPRRVPVPGSTSWMASVATASRTTG